MVWKREWSFAPKKTTNCTTKSNFLKIKICNLLIISNSGFCLITDQKHFQCRRLMKKLQSMQESMSALFKKHKKASTAILFVSFLLTFCVYPYANDDTSKYEGTFQSLPYKGALKLINYF